MKIRSAMLTDTGRIRKNNEDSCFVDDDLGLWIVADGMGGHAAGEVASRLCVDVIRDQVEKGLRTGTIPSVGQPAIHWSSATRLLAAAVWMANDVVYQASMAKPERQGMGTTVVAALRHGTRLALVHVGDSRFYQFRNNHFSCLTQDHSVVAEQVMQGVLTAAQAEISEKRNILSRAIGVGPTVEVDAVEPAFRHGDQFLLCTDGLTKMADDETIARVMGESHDAVDGCRRLVSMALDQGGRDNVTVAVGWVEKESVWEKISGRFHGWRHNRRST